MAVIYAKNKTTGEWERVSPETVEIDPTLTLEGSPADAKATGDALNEIRSQIGDSQGAFIATYGTTTYEEVINAYNAGKSCFVERSDSGITMLFHLTLVYDADSTKFVQFTSTTGAANAVYMLSSDNTWQETIFSPLSKDGGIMTGALTLSGAPTQDLHATTKKYVDDKVDEISNQVGGAKTSFILNSSTEGSAKQFAITIDDTGTLTVSEIVV